VPTQRIEQAQLSERGWARVVDQQPELAPELDEVALDGGQQLPRVGSGADYEDDAGPGCANTVVRLLAQPPGFLRARE
jgi:hypothetical protein